MLKRSAFSEGPADHMLVFVLEMLNALCNKQQSQLFVKCVQQCSDTTFSLQIWAASSDNSVTFAAARAT